MNLRRTRVVMTELFAGIVALFSITPLLLWRAERFDAINRDIQQQLVAQMDDVFLQELIGQRPDGFATWFVNVNDGWVDPYVDTDLEPPLFGWVRDAGLDPSFRSYSLDGKESYLAYIRPKLEGQGYVTIVDTSERDERLSSLNRRVAVMIALLAVGAGALGFFLSGLALRPVRRLFADQRGFLADAAHEMRTPLAVVLASSSHALSRARSSEEYVRSLSEIRAAAERASTGVNEMLDMVRLESGQVLPRLAALRLDLLAEEVAAAVRLEECEVVADPTDPVVVDADMALLRQALENVVRNAARRSSTVELRSRVDGRDGVIEVSDNGPGFDAAVVDKVFERYQRGDRRGEAGIGLAIVKAIVNAHGGTVAAANQADGGAMVSLRIPLNRAAHQ
jgi:two-component system, OmpR family, sensor kinase